MITCTLSGITRGTGYKSCVSLDVNIGKIDYCNAITVDTTIHWVAVSHDVLYVTG